MWKSTPRTTWNTTKINKHQQNREASRVILHFWKTLYKWQDSPLQHFHQFCVGKKTTESYVPQLGGLLPGFLPGRQQKINSSYAHSPKRCFLDWETFLVSPTLSDSKWSKWWKRNDPDLHPSDLHHNLRLVIVDVPTGWSHEVRAWWVHIYETWEFNIWKVLTCHPRCCRWDGMDVWSLMLLNCLHYGPPKGVPNGS